MLLSPPPFLCHCTIPDYAKNFKRECRYILYFILSIRLFVTRFHGLVLNRRNYIGKSCSEFYSVYTVFSRFPRCVISRGN